MSVEDDAVTGTPAAFRSKSYGKSLILKELQDSKKTGIVSCGCAGAQDRPPIPAAPSGILSRASAAARGGWTPIVK
jgi:hypothetical protein